MTDQVKIRLISLTQQGIGTFRVMEGDESLRGKVLTDFSVTEEAEND